MWYTHTTDYAASKMKEILSDPLTWMNQEDVILREISQSQKAFYHSTHILKFLVSILDLPIFSFCSV